ncbi:MAG: D-2-hydroxyacid dehydrogenase [Clostridia bacterium]|nr:D-2-hydroxyacid dehydrogenase [Clostridia bacterium]
MKKILVSLPVEDSHKALLEAAAPGCCFCYKELSAITPADAEDKDIIIGNVPVPVVQAAKNLQWLQTNSAGVEGYIRPGVLPEGARLTNATGAYGLAISEYMVAVLLSMMKRLPTYRDTQHKHIWASQGKVKSIYGSTVLVLGMGDIGGEFAKRAKAMGAYVIGVRRTDTRQSDVADEVHTYKELDELLPRADVVAMSLPGTPETTNIISRERLALMKDGAYIVNVGRGTAIDTNALCDALRSGKLAGAALDVTEPEPLPEDHPLWDIETALITPHVSGHYHLQETFERIVRISAENLRHFLAGERLRNEVDFSTGYRKLV